MLKNIIKLKGWKQSDMAEKIGMPLRTFKFKLAQPSRFSKDDRVKIARALGLRKKEIDEIVEGL